MIDQADAGLLEWLAEIAGDAKVTLGPPSDAPADTGISVFLVQLAPLAPLGGESRPPLQFAARYLVTTWASDPRTAHRLLGDLVFSAMRREDVEVELDPVPTETWRALGVGLRPAVWLKVPVRMPQVEPEAKMVRKPLLIQGTHLISVRGIVTGPGEVPLAGARVEVPSANTWTETDARGQFIFTGLPADPEQKLFRVILRGRHVDVNIDHSREDQPVMIRVDHLPEA